MAVEPLQNRQIMLKPTAGDDEEDSDLELLLALQNAFESEDWSKYADVIQGIIGSGSNASNVFKQINMACKMVTSELTSDMEKEEAIKYIKENHSKVLEML